MLPLQSFSFSLHEPASVAPNRMKQRLFQATHFRSILFFLWIFSFVSLVSSRSLSIGISGTTVETSTSSTTTTSSCSSNNFLTKLVTLTGGSSSSSTSTVSSSTKQQHSSMLDKIWGQLTIQAKHLHQEDSSSSSTSGSHTKDILVVFSDLDGTLIHYPESIPKRLEKHNSLLKLPKSATGLRGVISSKTLSLVQDIRRQNVKFVLISGMRTSTFLSRVPFLPRADAYCTEAGGRIFYPVPITDENDDKDPDNNDKYNEDDNSEHELYIVKPQKYDGATKEDLKPFGLVEDFEWRQKMEGSGAGKFGSFSLKELAANPEKTVPELHERDGLLWDFARDLTHNMGFVIDTKGYSACFRVNKKQQKVIPSGSTTNKYDFEALLDGRIKPWTGLATSVNMACVDYYPATSGKRNCCQYLAEKFNPERNKEHLLFHHAVCMCDDDNDLEMALACQHAYIPTVSSESMIKVIQAYPEHFTQTGGDDHGDDDDEMAVSDEQNKEEMIPDILASEKALSLVLSRVTDSKPKEAVKDKEAQTTEMKFAD